MEQHLAGLGHKQNTFLPGTRIPVVHTVELLDWATGGPAPAALTTAVDRPALA